MKLPSLSTIGTILSPFGLGPMLQRNRGEREQADEKRRAEQEALEARRAGHEVTETRRGGRLDLIAALLQGLQGSLGPGAPNYNLDPSALAALRTRAPFTETLGADPNKGAGASLLSGLLGQGQNALVTALTGMPGFGGPAPAPPAPSLPGGTRPTEGALTRPPRRAPRSGTGI